MKISVIVPVYNSAATIVEVLNSIVNQSFNNYILEVIVINDGSTDESESLIQKYIDEKFNQAIPIILISQKNSGVSASRNNGMKAAKGNWIAFCDSDDLWFERKLEHQINLIENSDNEIDILGGYVFEKPFRILWKRYVGLFKPKLEDVLIKSFPWSSGVVMKKEIFENIGGFEVGRNYGEDMLYYLKVMKNYNFYFDTTQVVDVGFGKHPFGESGLSSNLGKMNEGQINLLIYLLKEGRISKFKYYIFYFYYFLKHIRRIIISKNIK